MNSNRVVSKLISNGEIVEVVRRAALNLTIEEALKYLVHVVVVFVITNIG